MPYFPHYFGSSILTGPHLLPIPPVLLVLTLRPVLIVLCLPTSCLSFSPGLPAAYNCLFSWYFLASHAVSSCSFILSCEATSVLLVCSLTNIHSSPYTVSALCPYSVLPLAACYPDLCLPEVFFLLSALLSTLLFVPSVALNYHII